MEAGDYKNLDFLRRKGSSISHMPLFKKKKQFKNLHFSRRDDSHKQNLSMQHCTLGWMPATQNTVMPQAILIKSEGK